MHMHAWIRHCKKYVCQCLLLTYIFCAKLHPCVRLLTPSSQLDFQHRRAQFREQYHVFQNCLEGLDLLPMEVLQRFVFHLKINCI